MLGAEEEPASSCEGSLQLGIRLPDGRRLTRRFGSSGTVGQVAAFVQQEGVGMGGHVLTRQRPRRVFDEWGMTLQEAGVESYEVLTVEPKQ